MSLSPTPIANGSFKVLDSGQLHKLGAQAHYSKAELIKLFELVKIALPRDSHPFTTKKENDTVANLRRGRTTDTLANINLVVKSIFFDDDNLKILTDAWPQEFREIIKQILRHKIVGEDKLDTFVNMEITGIVAERRLIKELLQSSLQMSQRSYEYYGSGFGFRFDLWQRLARFFDLPEAKNEINGLDTLPEGFGTFNFESEAVAKAPRAIELINEANIDSYTTAVSPIKVATLKQLALNLHMEEFLPDEKKRQYNQLRIGSYILFLAKSMASYVYRDQSTALDALGYADFLREKFFSYARSMPQWLNYCMPFVKVARENSDNLNVNEYASSIIGSLRKAETTLDNKNAWLPTEDIYNTFYNLTGLPMALGLSDISNYFYSSIIDDQGGVRIYDIETRYSKPLLNSFLAILCSLGMVEIAVDKSKPVTGENFFNEIQYVRLTPLGKYVTKLTDSYTPPAYTSDKKASIAIDGQNMLVTILDPEATNYIKSEIGEKITTSRYKITETSLMRKTSSARDLKMKRSNLLDISGLGALPESLEDIFKKLIKRFDSISVEAMDDYVLFELPNDPGLLKFVRNSPEVRSMVKLVEGNGLLILRSQVVSLRSLILKGAGYYLPALPQQSFGYYTRW